MIRRILVTTALCAAASLAVLIASGPGMRSAAVTGTAELANWGLDSGGGESSSQSFGAGLTAGEVALGEAESQNFGAQGGFRASSLCFDDNDGLDDAAEAALGTSTCAFDSDVDGLGDGLEAACGSNPANALSKPERIDLPGDEDGDGQFNEALPPGAEAYDCDGDGYTGAAEAHAFSYKPQTNGDQKTCGEYDASFPNASLHPSLRWPADIVGGTFSGLKVNISDLAAYIGVPRYLNTDVGTNPGDVRFDVVPGHTFGNDINLADLQNIAFGTAPMFGGVRMFNGPVCPYAP